MFLGDSIDIIKPGTPRIEPKDVFKWRDCSSNPNVAFLKHFPSSELDPSWVECIHRDFELITGEYAMSTYEVIQSGINVLKTCYICDELFILLTDLLQT